MHRLRTRPQTEAATHAKQRLGGFRLTCLAKYNFPAAGVAPPRKDVARRAPTAHNQPTAPVDHLSTESRKVDIRA